MRRRPLITLMLVLPMFAAMGCSSNTGSNPEKRMFVSNKDFQDGRADGRRDAKNAWSDDSSAWLWDWMMSQQYKTGYAQGWREGRNEARFESQKQNAESLQE